MHSAIEPAPLPHAYPAQAEAKVINLSEPSTTYAHYRIMRRNGAVVSFEPSKIAIAMTKAFLAISVWGK